MKFVPIDSVDKISNYSGTVYDIEVEGNEHFIANSIITHNCRLKNEITDNEFSYSLGAGGLMTGSTGVMTTNENRLAQFAIKDYCKSLGYDFSFSECHDYALEHTKECIDVFMKELENHIRQIHKFQAAHRDIIVEYKNAGLLSVYDANYIVLEKQFCTLGVAVLNECAEFFGYEVSCNEEYLKFCADVLALYSKLNKEGTEKYGIKFNTELIPGESVCPKNFAWDKSDDLWINQNRICYNSYMYLPDSTNTSIPDKFKMHGGVIADSLDGGSALHLNLAGLPDKEFFLWLRSLAAKYHCTYWTTNVKSTICNNCGHIDYHTLDTCPKCGSTDLDYSTRIIGYNKKISSFSKERREEEKVRYYH